VSAIDRIAIRRVDVERATVISAQPFAAVVSKLAAAIGHPDMSEFTSAVAAARSSADLEAVVNAAIGTAGLMEMAHFDIGEVLRKDMPGAPKALRLPKSRDGHEPQRTAASPDGLTIRPLPTRLLETAGDSTTSTPRRTRREFAVPRYS
jgi:hypothetical protein